MKVKTGFRVIDMLKTEYHGKVHCSRCDKEYPADRLIYARPLKGPNSKYLHWYCSTDNCLGRLNYGIYFVSISS